MTTITDIRNDLVNVFNKLRDGTMEAKDAVEMNNTAGKIISSVKVQLAYAALRNEQPNIPFLAEPPREVAALGTPAAFPSVSMVGHTASGRSK